MDAENLSASFHSYFRVSLAVSPKDQERLFRARYQVYCREFGYEREEDCPGGRETDHFDGMALHAQVVHKQTNTLAGCVRLVTPTPAYAQLPIEEAWRDELAHGSRHPSRFSADTTCEISRLAVPAAFRRRPHEGNSPIGDVRGLVFSDEEVRTFPLISLGLFLIAASMAHAVGRPNVYAIMEPRLARMLARSGFHFKRIGDIRDYHGRRAPYYVHHEDAILNLRSDLRPLYDDIDEQLVKEIRQCNPIYAESP